MVQKGVEGVYTAMIKHPFEEWDRVDTFLHSLSTWGSIKDIFIIKGQHKNFLMMHYQTS